MKTNFFLRFSLPQEIKEKLLSLLDMNETAFEYIADQVKKDNSLRNLSNNEVRELVQKSGLPTQSFLENLNNFVAILGFLALQTKDNYQDVIDDLLEILGNSVKDVSIYNKRMSKFGEMVKSYTVLYKSNDAKKDGTPILRKFESSVILKPVFDERFDFDEMDIKKYEPKLIKKIACILLRLENSDKDVNFNSIIYHHFS